MPEPTVISIDAMGGDHGPSVVVPGLALLAPQWSARGVKFLLHGQEAALKPELAKTPRLSPLCEIRHTDLVIASDEKPAQAMRRGKGSSMWNAVEAIRAGEAKGAVSAGNTGALMAISKLILRMISQIERPSLVARWPSLAGATTVLDVGANIDCDAQRLVEFAIMGEAFHRALTGVARPSVGLLNVGSEDQKGHEEVREAARLLREGGIDLDFRGFVEGSDISKSVVDVVVTDGFTGNVALKTAEGTARFIGAELRTALRGSPLDMLGAFIATGALRKLMTRLNPSTLDGAPLLGLAGLVVKCHGGTDPRGFSNGVKVAVDLAESQYATEITARLEQLTMALEAHEAAQGAEKIA